MVRLTKIKGSPAGYFIHMSPKEALATIRSLSSQLMDENANSNRLESYTDKGEYISIGVQWPEETNDRSERDAR